MERKLNNIINVLEKCVNYFNNSFKNDKKLLLFKAIF